MSVNTICRLCLYETKKFSSLTDNSEISFALLLKLEQLFSINNFQNMELPNVICRSCEVKTNHFYNFWTLVSENQAKLEEAILYPEERLDEDLEEVVDHNNILCKEEVLLYEEIKDEAIENVEYNIAIIEAEEVIDQEILFECELCSLQFSDKNDIEVHMKTNHKKRTGSSSTKSKHGRKSMTTKKTKEQIEKEDETIRNFFDLRCPTCVTSPQFQTFIDWRNHQKTEHKNPNAFISCCGKRLVEKRKVLSHATLHTDPDSLKCKICSRQCISQPRLEEHMRDYHNPTGLKYQCDKCPRSYATSSAMQHHLSTHLSDAEREQRKLENKCPHCDQGYVTRPTLINHIRNSHLKVSAGVCHICAKSFSSKQSLKIHYDLKHSENPPEKKQCPICYKWMPGERFLTKHINRIHKKNAVHACSICSKTLSSEDHLRKHVENVHSNKPKYPCPHCDKAYRWPMGLKEHMATHYGGFLYQCNYCDKSCNSNSNMLKHKRQAHFAEYEAERKKASINNPNYERLQENK